jgi:putative sugar O-methyltransferase
MKVTSDLYRLFGDLSAYTIVEVGCGYGGLCKIISESYQVSQYTLVDLQEVLDLADEFLFRTGADLDWIDFASSSLTKYSDHFDLFISNYALTECTREVQMSYIERLAAKADRGYITANFINHHFGLDQLSLEEMLAMLPGAKVIDEVPNTNPDNRILVWGHNAA